QDRDLVGRQREARGDESEAAPHAHRGLGPGPDDPPADAARRPLGPARRATLQRLERGPVVSGRREDVEHDGAFRARDRVVRRVRWDRPRVAGPELALLAAEAESHRATQDEAELLVLVRVLG